jgi:uncharacterized protein (DUF1501 family)
MTLILPRRRLLAFAGVGALTAALPGIAWAAPATPKRLVFIIQRGAADGLALVPPVGDPAYAPLRGALAAEATPGMKLNGLFALHAALAGVGAMMAAKEARIVHAIATGYRDRSHFDGQNILESGGATPYGRRDGWLNRLLALLPAGESRAVGIAAAVPLALRGAQEAANYAPSRLPGVDEDLLLRLTMLYGADAQLGPIWQQAVETKELAGDIGGNNGRNGTQLAELATRLMAGDDGARVMMIETGGWDTHSAQARRLEVQARGLDALLVALKSGLGADWAQTLVIVATEFGRTAAVNGTGGTDHGTASALFLLGGGLAGGGTVQADWPGLAAPSLHEGRDLKPTASLESEISAAVAAHYGLDPGKVRRTLYPDLV